MRAPALLAELRSRDIQVWIDHGRLRCNAPANALTPELRDELQQRRDDILEFLRLADALANQQRAIVPLQPCGARTPVFAVPGHIGDVFCYRALVQHLGDDQPFYGLQPPGFDGQGEPLRRIEDLAAYFAAQIRAFRPEGPYILAGFCAGGLTAFELGLQLASAGAEISFLALFGAPYSARYRRLPRLRELLAEQVERVAKHARTLRSLSSVERREYIAAKLRVREARHTAQRLAASDPVLVLRGKVGGATLAAARCYTPRHSASRVCLFMPSGDWVRSRNEPLRWLSVAPHAEVYYGPDGCDGEAMLYEQYAPAFAELFRRSRERKA